MAAQEDDPTEIDEFAMFKARSLGVESEYLEMARVGLLRRSMRQKVPLGATKQLQQPQGRYAIEGAYLQHNGILANEESGGHAPRRVSSVLKAGDGSGARHLFPVETTNLQRAHSFRARRRAHEENRSPIDQQGNEVQAADTGDCEDPGKLSRHRNMTMPTRRRHDKVAAAAAAAGNENVRSRHHRNATDDVVASGEHVAPGDRSVLRVRNFTTKDGSIINRGDSIKIRRGGKATGLSSPLGRDNCKTFGNCITVQHLHDGGTSPRSGSLKGGGFAARRSIAASLACSDAQRLYSSSATHLAANNGVGSPGDEQPLNSQRRDSQLRTQRLSRRFQSQDEERPQISSTPTQGRQDDLELSASSSSVIGLRGRQSNQPNEETIELEYLGESQAAQNDPVASSPQKGHHYHHYHQQQYQEESDAMGICAAAAEDDNDGDEAAVEKDGGEGVKAEDEVRDEGEDGEVEEEEEEEQVVYKVVVMGMVGVGKTTLTQQMLTSEYLANNEGEIDLIEEAAVRNNYDDDDSEDDDDGDDNDDDDDDDDESTDKIVSVQIDGEESLLQFIDHPGLQGAKRKDELIHADANLVVYSVTDRNSYAFAQTCLQDLRPAKRHNAVILVANKQDLVRNRVISEDDGKSLAHKRHCKFIEVSALLSHKVDDLLVGVTRQIRLRKAIGQESGAGGKSGNQSENRKSKNSDNDLRVGCLQRAAMDIFRRITRRRRLVESSSCDDLFKP